MRHLYRLKLVAFFFLLTFISHLSVAQISPVTGERILPMSPDAKAFSKYGEYPVDHSTGVPQIQIPIYQVQSGSLMLPISLDYHASGIKVEEISSCVGLGWTLKAGGMIARSIRGGGADDVEYGFLTETVPTSDQINSGTWETMRGLLYAIATGQIDTESDKYTYSVGDKLFGSFVYNRTKELTPLSYSEHIVERLPANNTYQIISDDGTRYYFDQKEVSIDYDQNRPYPSTWLITKIISFDNADTISFEYSKHPFTFTQQLLSQSIAYQKLPCHNSLPMFGSLQSTRSAVHSDVINLDRIKFKNGYVKFDYIEDRKDSRYLRLTGIKIFNNSKCIQQYKLNQSYFESWTRYTKNEFHYRLKLDEIQNLGGDGQYLNSYRFEYNNEPLPPYFDPTKPYPTECFGVDYWGYNNGRSDNQSFIYGIPETPHLKPADRKPDIKYTKSCILEKIEYPTGGCSIFNYEANKDDSNYIVGGLRISSILSRASSSAPYLIKRYEYKEGIHVRPDDFFESYMLEDLHNLHGINRRDTDECQGCWSIIDLYYGTPLNPLGDHNGSYMVYGLVNEYTEGEGESMKILVSYRYMTEQDGRRDVDFPKFHNFYTIDRSWLRGKLIEQNFYKWVDSKYELVKSKEYKFRRMHEQQIDTGIKLSRKWTNSGCHDTRILPSTPIQQTYSYFDVFVEAGILKLEHEKIRDFMNGQVVEDATFYDYSGNGHLYPTRLSNTKSDGKTEITTSKYTDDIVLTGEAEKARIKLKDSNFRIAKLEEVVERDEIVLFRKVTDYALFSGNPYPKFVKVYKGGEVASEVTSYSYDKGRVVEFRRNNDFPISIIWGYKGAYPIAELKNENYVNIQDLLGVSTLDELYKREATDPLVEESIQILRSSLRLKNCHITTYTYEPLIGLSSLTDPNNRVTRFKYDNFQRLMTTSDHDGNILRHIDYSYKPYQKIYLNEELTLSITKNNCGEGFRGTSVNFTAMKGLFASTISEADATGKARIYLRANVQQYANEHGICLPIPSYFNTELNMPFQKNDCSSGIGSVVTYSVPAAKYISYISQVDVDNKALNEANSNGQAFANSRGICSAIFYNTARSKYFSRQCPVSYSTYPVLYTVPLGKYTSLISQQDADQKAINEINENGQSYANSNGECYVNIDYSDWTLYISDGNCTLIRPIEDSIIPVEIEFNTPGIGYTCMKYIPQGVTQYEFRLPDCPSYGAAFVDISHVEYLN